MSTESVFEYKCRRCGVNFAGGHYDRSWYENEHHDDAIIYSGFVLWKTMHDCADQDGCGIADLVGVASANSLPKLFDSVKMYAVASRQEPEDDSQPVLYAMHDGPCADLDHLIVHGFAGPGPNARILEMLAGNEGNGPHYKEIYRWDHMVGRWLPMGDNDGG